MERYEDLTEEQRVAHLVVWYDSEEYNGGHMQYFENRKGEHLSETIAALGALGANCQQQVLREASDLYFSRRHAPIQTVDEYSTLALEGNSQTSIPGYTHVRQLFPSVLRLISKLINHPS